MHVHHCRNSAEPTNKGAVFLTLTVDSSGVANLRQNTRVRFRVLEECKPLRVRANRESFKVLGDDSSHVFMINKLGKRSLISCCRSLQVRDSFVAVQVFMRLGLNCLLDCTKCVLVHGNARLEPKLKSALVLAKDLNRTLILTLARLSRVRIDVAVGHIKILRIGRISHIVRHEEELVGAQVQLSHVLGFRKLAHFKSIHRHLFLLVIEAG